MEKTGIWKDFFTAFSWFFLAIARDFMQRKIHGKKCDAGKQHLKIYQLNIAYHGT